MGLSHEENLLDLTPHDLGKGCGSGRLFAVVFPRSRRASFSEFRRASSLKLVRPSATAREHSRSRIAFGEETLTSCLTRVGGPEIGWGWIAGRALARQFLPLKKPWFETPHPAELDDGRAIPLPSDIENHLQNKDHQDCAWMLVDIDMSKLSDKTERLNICLPSRALRRLDSLAANLAKTIFSLKD